MLTVALLASADTALAGHDASARMGEYADGTGYVDYQEGMIGPNDVWLPSYSGARTVKIEDDGTELHPGWGWGASYGCHRPQSWWPSSWAECHHPNGIRAGNFRLGYGNDRLRHRWPSQRVTAWGGHGTDWLDVRNGSGGDVADCGDGVDWVFVDAGDQALNCESVPLGGVLSSGAVAASRGAGTLDVFARGADGALWQRTWSGSSWSQWTPVPGHSRLVDAPAVASWGPGRLDVFARGTDDALWHTWYDGGRWAGWWESLGGQLTSAPAAASWGAGRLDVFVRWSDGNLRQKFFDGTSWSGWIDLGGQLTSKPAAASSGSGRVHVFARGTDSAVYQLAWDGSNWNSWQRFDSQSATPADSAPAVASRGPGMLDVIVRRTDTAGRGSLRTRSLRNGSWSAQAYLGGELAGMKSDPGLVAWDSGRLDAFVRVNDDSIYQLMLP